MAQCLVTGIEEDKSKSIILRRVKRRKIRKNGDSTIREKGNGVIVANVKLAFSGYALSMLNGNEKLLRFPRGPA